MGEPRLNRPGTLGSESRLQQLVAVLACAQRLSEQHALHLSPTSPLLLVTDHNIIRAFVAERHIALLVTLNQTVVHTRSP